MAVFQTHDVELVNRIVNDDAVRPFVHDDGAFHDWREAVEPPTADTGILILTDGNDSAAAFVKTAPAIYQCHWFFGPSCRGRDALKLCTEMVDWLRERGVKILWGTTPLTNKQALWFNRRMGAVPTWTDGEEQVFEYRMAS